jgi:membrane dipeptidase
MANAILITETLVDRGYSDDDVLKILGGNFLRVFEQAWRPAVS